MKLVNLTPHDIDIDGYGSVPVSGVVARIDYDEEPFDAMDGVVVYEHKNGRAVNLPEPADDTYYIVSSIVRMAVQRYDLVSPAHMIRDRYGKIVGCRSLVVGGSDMMEVD